MTGRLARKTGLQRTAGPRPGGPLARHVPLVSTTPLERHTPLTPGGPLPARSAETVQVYEQERRPLVAALLAARPWCEIRWSANGCQSRAVDVHELLSRARGGSITQESNCIVGCRWCHTQVTENPAEAEARGLALKSGRPANALPRPWIGAA